MRQYVLLVTSIVFFMSCKPADKKEANNVNHITNMAGGDVTISGTVTGIAENGYFVFTSQNNDESFKKDSVPHNNGKFSFTTKFTEPSFYVLGLAGENEKPSLVFFADPGNMTINGNIDSLDKAKVTGGATQKEYENIFGRLMAIYKQDDALYEDFKKASDNNDTATVSSLQKQHDAITTEGFRFILDYATQNPGSLVSAYLLLINMNNENMEKNESIAETAKIYEGLASPVKNSFFGKQVKKTLDGKMSTMIGGVAKDFSQNDVNGKPISLSSFKGKYVLIDFWASWCGPCRAENPNVVTAYNKYHNKGFEILGVSLDQEKAKWLEAIKKDNLTWTHVSDLQGWQNAVAKIYGIQSIPASFLLDKDGKIVGRDLRGEALEAKLGEVLK